MSTEANKADFKPNPTQGDFWGGYMTEGWLYKFLAIFPLTGFLGIDKLALRSPFTAILKFFVNVFLLGGWYFYDIIQLLTDEVELVGKYGFSTPFGVSGHGYRLLHNLTSTKVDEFSQPSPYNGGLIASLLFLCYLGMTAFLGFTGFPAMLAGDFNGGLMKLFSNFLIIPFFFYFFAQLLDVFRCVSLEKDGVNHPWPLFPFLTIFEKYPAMNLLPEEQGKKELAAHTAKYQEEIKTGKQPFLIEIAMKLFGKAWEAAGNIPVIAAFNTVSAGKGAVQAASDTAQSAAKVGQKLATALEQRISKDPNEVIDKLLGAPAVPAVPAVAVPAPAPVVQQGGGTPMFTPELDTIMLMAIGFLIVGGFSAALLRKFVVPRRQEDDEYPRKVYERDDAPPNPGGV
jgi:hypothetical protein